MSFTNKFGQYTNVQCGLICLGADKSTPTPIPLESVIIRATLISPVAKVELMQVYINKEEQPIEAIYYFPVDANGGVTHFQAELEGRILEGTVKPLREAESQYQKAVEQNQSAFMLESNKPDIFKIRIGFLKPGAQVKITIGYVTEVKNEKGSNSTRFFIPTTVAPRYIPDSATGEETLNLKNMQFADKSPAPLSISVNVAVQGKVKSIESPSHKIEIEEMESSKKNWTRAVVQLFGKTTDMDRDFILLVFPEEIHIPRLYSEKMANTTALMAHLIPSFNVSVGKVELIFVLDRSGSMQGASIELAKQALILFLHSLPVDCYFNVVGFGSTYQFMFPNSVKYDDDSLKKASNHCKFLDADLGGTEIFDPLSTIFKQKLIPEYSRQIFVLTDGEVGNTDEVIALCKDNASRSRVFSLGIGSAASQYLVEGMALAGGGTAVFVSYEETIEARVLQQLKNATQSSLSSITISWSGIEELEASETEAANLLTSGKPVNNSSVPSVELSKKSWRQAPENVPPIFDGSQLIVFGVFPNKCVPNGVRISADSPAGPLSMDIELSEENNCDSNGILHKLAAIQTVKELEMKIKYFEQNGNRDDLCLEALEKQLISIACEHGLISRHTAYIAVDTTNGNTDCLENWVMQTRYVPSQFAHGWHGRDGGGYGMANVLSCVLLDPYDEIRSCTYGLPPLSARNYRSKSLSACPTPGLFSCAGRNRSYTKKRKSVVKLCSSHEIEPISNEECDFEEYRPTVPPFLETQGVPVVKSKPQDYLHAIVITQSFNGSFPLNEAFAEAICKPLTTLKEVNIGGWDDQAWATALALVFFKEKLNDLKDSWELVEQKARNWLETNHGDYFEAIVVAASAFLRSSP